MAREGHYPIQSGVTPTAGGVVVFFRDMGGNFYAVHASSGQKLWGRKIGGAVATGLTKILRPTERTTAKVLILGLGAGSQ